MVDVMFLLVGIMMAGVVGVVSNPSPFFAAVAMVVGAGAGCGLLAFHGGTFLSLVLFLIYLGGMLVVFAYSAALAADPFPEGWGSLPVLKFVVLYSLGVILAGGIFWGNWGESSWFVLEEWGEFNSWGGDSQGVAMLYSKGGVMMVVSVWAIFVALFVVLELVRGFKKGVLRAI